MASLFDKDPGLDRPLTNVERIAPEVAHLKKGTSVRQGPGAATRTSLPYLITLAVCGLLWLYAMDPVLYAWHKNDAIKVYTYLHNYGSQAKINALVATHILTADEISYLDRRQGSFENYFTSATDAEDKADAIVKYIQSVKDLHEGKYDQLSTVGKIRYVLFIKPGIYVPTSWSALNPGVK